MFYTFYFTFYIWSSSLTAPHICAIPLAVQRETCILASVLGIVPSRSIDVHAKDSLAFLTTTTFFCNSMTLNTVANCSDVPCWTCRRRRLRCDRALPVCGKCASSQRSCQGYSKDKPLRWTDSVASRGKLMGKKVPRQEQNVPISRVLNDPSVQDLSPSMRHYIAYCKEGV